MMDIGCEGHRLSGEDGEGLDWGAFRMYWPGRFWKKKEEEKKKNHQLKLMH